MKYTILILALLFTTSAFAGADPAILQATATQSYDSDGDGVGDTEYASFEGTDNYSWENPDITIYKKQNGADVTGKELSQGTEYMVKCVVYNYGDTDASAVTATLGYAYSGTGQDFEDIGDQSVDVAAGSSTEVIYYWHPVESGHFCLDINLTYDSDENTENNWGQRNTEISEATLGDTIRRRFFVANKIRVINTADGVKVQGVSTLRMAAFVRLDKANDTQANRDLVKVRLTPQQFNLKGKSGRWVKVFTAFDKELPDGCTVFVNVQSRGVVSGRIMNRITIRYTVNQISTEKMILIQRQM